MTTVLVFADNRCSFLGEEPTGCVLMQCISWLSEDFGFNENEGRHRIVCASEVFWYNFFTAMFS